MRHWLAIAKWLACAGFVALYIVTLLFDPTDGLIAAAVGIAGAVVVGGASLVGSGGRSTGRLSRAAVVMIAVAAFGIIGGLSCERVRFWMNHAYYVRHAEAQLVGGRGVAGVTDRTGLLCVFIYDPDEVGVAEWRRFTEIPGTCRSVGRHWYHCEVS